jgi:hypothetical protein
VALTGSTVKAEAIRAEVERRMSKRTADGKSQETPYLLLLVRPQGIRCYYAFLNALSGLKFDFGYEFIDGDWVLDFPSDADQPTTQPWMVAAPGGSALPAPGSPGSGSGSAAAVTVLPPVRGLGGQPGSGGVETGVGPASGGSAMRFEVPGQGSSSPMVGRLGNPSEADGRIANPSYDPKSPQKPQPAAASDKKQEGSQGSAAEAGRESQQPGETSPRNPLTPLGPADKKPKPSAPQPTRFISNRDWIIPIDCRADVVVLYPSGREFKAADLTVKGSDNPLVQAVKHMIERRQASVPPGEPPYRPQVRFLIRPDGMRSFFLAYPPLDVLRVPMTRQNLEADEEVSGGR